MTNFQPILIFFFFFGDIRNLGILSGEDVDFVKTKTKKAALSSFRQYDKNECAKFRGSPAIVGLVPSCHRVLVSPKIFLVGILLVQNILLWVFREPHIFSRGYFLSPKFLGIWQVSIFFVGISWIQDFFVSVFRGSKIF